MSLTTCLPYFFGGDKEADIECIKNIVKVKKKCIKRKLHTDTYFEVSIYESKGCKV